VGPGPRSAPPSSARVPAAGLTPSPPSGRAAGDGGLPPEVVAALGDPSRTIGALPADVQRARGLPPTAGRYVVLGELGRGGMGVVYRAFDVSLRRPVAIKMILDAAQAGKNRVARFMREASATARLRHQHIVAVHEVGEHQGRPFIVMDLVDGESLEALLEREEGLPPKRTAELVEQVALALEHAHQAGVVHRDVKPQNVMIDRAGKAHLMDFGLARDTTERDQLTQSGQLLGTPSYMAPEQATGQTARQGPLSDVYALGAVLYRVLVGRPPFEADSMLQLAQQVVSVEPEPPRSVNPGVHPDLETIALRCLEKDPAQRYASAADLAADLRHFLDGEPIVARAATGWERARRVVRRHRAAALGGVVALLAATGSVVGAVTWRAMERRAEVEQAWQAATGARGAFAQRLEQTPLPYAAAHAAALEAFRHLDRALNLDPRHADARRTKYEVAMRMGELALAERDFGLATTMFAAAGGLAVDDAAAEARLKAVEEARGEEERRIRRGVEELLQELEGAEAAPPEHGSDLWRVLRAGTEVAALTGGRRAGALVVHEACRSALLDAKRAAAARVAAGLVLAAMAPSDPAALDPLTPLLARDDPVGVIVGAHVLAASGAPRFGAPLRAARERLARRMREAAAGDRPPLDRLERDLLAELGRVLLLHGDPEGARAVIEELLSEGSGEFGSSLDDFAGTLGPRTAALYGEVLRRANGGQRLATLLGIDQSDEVDLARLGGALADLLRAPPEADRLPIIQALVEVPFPFDALYATALFTGDEATRASSASWQAVRMLVRADDVASLLRASDATDAWTRGVVALALGEATSSAAVTARLEALRGDGSPWVRACAALALARGLHPAALAALEEGERTGEPVATALLAGVRFVAGASAGAPLREVFEVLRDTQPIGLSRRALPSGCLGQRAAPVTSTAEPSITLASTGIGGQLVFAERSALPPSVALLGRTARFVRASALRSTVAHVALEDALKAAPAGGRRAQGALRLMSLLGHPRATAHAHAQLDAGGGFFLEVEALRTLIARGDARAPATLRALRERWTRDPSLARGLAAPTLVRSPTATISAPGSVQQVLGSCLVALGDAATPDALRELVRWTDSPWTAGPAFAALDRLGEEGVAALDAPDLPAGAGSYLEGWWAYQRTGDRARARAAFERAAAAGWGAPRAHLLLAWLALGDRPVDARRAHAHLVAARRAGSSFAGLATFWQGWVAFRHLHRPLEAEACWRSLLLDDDQTKVPPPAGPLPALEQAGPEDAPRGPWSDARGDPSSRMTTPFLDGGERQLALASLAYYLGVERGDDRAWPLMAEVYARGVDAKFNRLLPLLAEVALRAGQPDGVRWVFGAAPGAPPADPTWPAWQAAAPAFVERRPDTALRALAPLAAADGEAGAAARWLLAHLARAHGAAPDARRLLDVALARDPGDPRLHRDAALLDQDAGDLVGALVHARATARTDPWLVAGAGQDAQGLVVDLVTRLVGAPLPADPAAASARAALLREVVPALPAQAEAWAAAWSALRETARWDPDGGALR
jgi:predicted Ser/Thr protein kinase